MSEDIKTPGAEDRPSWDSSDQLASLRALCVYAEKRAVTAVTWYSKGKKRKRRLSVLARFLTIVLTALGGLIPIAAAVFYGSAAQEVERLRFHQWGYLAVGLAGLALAFDRYYGGSSGWMRYISTTLVIESLTEEFRFDWLKIEAGLALQPKDSERVLLALERIKTFVLAVRAQVEKETQAWVTEFQSTMTQLEKQTEDALQAARDQARKDLEAQIGARKAAVDAERPGAINITVTSGPLKDGYSVEIDGRKARSGVTGKTCGIVGITPGIHEIAAFGTAADGTTKHASTVITIVPLAITRIDMDLS